jgi:hypothetical protein
LSSHSTMAIWLHSCSSTTSKTPVTATTEPLNAKYKLKKSDKCKPTSNTQSLKKKIISLFNLLNSSQPSVRLDEYPTSSILESYLDKLEESKSHVEDKLNSSPPADTLVQYDEDCFESFINKHSPGVLMGAEQAPSVCRHFEGKVFQAVPETVVPVVKIKEETTQNKLETPDSSKARFNSQIFRNIEMHVRSRERASVGQDGDGERGRKRDCFKKLLKVFKRH